MSNASRTYTATAKWLHWIMATLIIVASIIGIYAASLHYGIDAVHDKEKAGWITAHKQIATITLFLIVIRILWRVTHKPPEFLGMSPIMVKFAHLGHFVLYALMLAVPISGWANSSAGGHPIPVAWLFTIPGLIDKNPAVGPYLVTLHEYLGWTIVVVVLAHIAFALKHRLIDRDGTMESMLPGRR
jgi:cytochrome b561